MPVPIRAPWLTTDWVLSQFSDSANRARQAYDDFVQQDLKSGRKAEYHTGTVEGTILGDDQFAVAVLKDTSLCRSPDYPLADVLVMVCQSYEEV